MCLLFKRLHGLGVFPILTAPFSVRLCPHGELWVFILLGGCGRWCSNSYVVGNPGFSERRAFCI